MTFAAMAAWQAWLLIGVAIAAAVALFLIKIKPPQILIPSLTLWSRVLGEARDETLWERIRRAVSLALAVLITLAIALAILRPQLTAGAEAPAYRAGAEAPAYGAGAKAPAYSGSTAAASGRPGLQPGQSDTGRPGPSAGRVSIVLDSSWSMLATTASGQTRWDRAVARARALATAAAGDDVVLSTTADGVIEGPTPDVSLIEAALDRVSPSGGDATAWPHVEGARVTYFLTDGAVARPLDAAVTVESVFEPSDNVAITAFDVRPGTTLESAGQAFLTVANYAKASQNVRITLARGAETVLDVRVDLAPGAAVDRVVPLDRAGDPRIRARVAAGQDALVVDDEAVAWIAGAEQLAVTVVSDQPASFGPFFSQFPGVRATFVSPKNYAPGREQLVIFDRVLPAAPARIPALFILPPSAPPLRTRGLKTRSGLFSKVTSSPVVGVDMQTMAIDTVRAYATEGLVPAAQSASGAPLVLVREQPDQRFVVFAFNVAEAKLMFAPGFPALMSSTIEWLAHVDAGGARRPGATTFAEALESIAGPDGRPVPFTNVDGVAVATLGRTGFYAVRSGGATTFVPVNAGDPDVSNLQRTHLSDAARADVGVSATRGRPWWLFAVAAAFLLVAAEWWTWQRRVTV